MHTAITYPLYFKINRLLTDEFKPQEECRFGHKKKQIPIYYLLSGGSWAFNNIDNTGLLYS